LLNRRCPRPPAAGRPLVLLDASLSMDAAGGHWDSALASALRLGDVRFFGDDRGDRRTADDSLPMRGRSALAPALTAAAASVRPVVVLTDGELDDARDLPADLLDRATIRVVPRDTVPDLALTALSGPVRITSGDSIVLEAEVRAVGPGAHDGVAVAVLSGTRELTRRPVRFDAAGIARVRLAASSAGIAAGDHLLRATVSGSADGEPRTDTRLHLVSVASAPGVVLIASP